MFFTMFIVILIAICIVFFVSNCYIVPQQTAIIIERFGKFNRIQYAGLHFKIPVIEKKAARKELRTMKLDVQVGVKTSDNVTITLVASAQYAIDQRPTQYAYQSGVYRSFYTLDAPVAQMNDYITDALRSAVPSYQLDDVFSKKDDIARDVQATVSNKMMEYGYIIVNTLITNIMLPVDVENSMNAINAAQRERVAAKELAEADRIRVVTEAKAKAEAMELDGVGIANQRKAIAAGVKESLTALKESNLTTEEADNLFRFTQWTDMMSEFAQNGKATTVVLPSDFNDANFLKQQLVADAAEKSNNNEAAISSEPQSQ